MSQSVQAMRNAFRIPELKQRILFTLIMIGIYRLGAQIPTPGVAGRELAELMQGSGGLLGFYDLFTGGAFQQATIFALGIMPYISASIIMQLLTAVIPSLEKLAKQGAEGQKKITEYTRYATIGLCIVQSLGIAQVLLQMDQGNPQVTIIPNPGFLYYATCVLTFTTGTAFIMWLGEQISEHGVGNGISLIIFVGIVARMPMAVFRMIRMIIDREITIFHGGMLIMALVAVVAGVIYVTLGQRRIPVQYPRQVKGRRMLGGQRSYLPLRVNQAGVIPIIFASSLLMLPAMFGGVLGGSFKAYFDTYFTSGSIAYNLAFAGLIVFFCYFYTAITFNPVDIADNMKKHGGVVMGVRPGRATSDYLEYVMNRITLVGACFLAGVALVPTAINYALQINDWTIASFFGGTSLLILVSVALDTVRQIEQHLVMRNYEGFMRAGRVRSSRRM